MDRSSRLRRWGILAAAVLLIPILLILGVWAFSSQYWGAITVTVACLSCVPFFVTLERGRHTGARELATLAVMVALSVVGRLVFQPLAGFKPVTAIVIITGMVFGAHAGFITGSMSALLSNFFFGHGPWTPFQMFVWGMIGLISGLVFRLSKSKPHPLLSLPLGVLGGVLFSLVMDIWTTFVADGTLTWCGYLKIVMLSMPQMLVYVASNVVFLLVLSGPLSKKLSRLKTKYGIFSH